MNRSEWRETEALAAPEGKREGPPSWTKDSPASPRVTNASAKTFWIFLSQGGERHEIKLGI
jgi:hypothetical protein